MKRAINCRIKFNCRHPDTKAWIFQLLFTAAEWKLDITNLCMTNSLMQLTTFFTQVIVKCMEKNLDKTKPRYIAIKSVGLLILRYAEVPLLVNCISVFVFLFEYTDSYWSFSQISHYHYHHHHHHHHHHQELQLNS